MKQNYKKLLMILPILPLMMANSPVKVKTDFNYYDFEMNFLGQESTGYYDTYSYHLNNYGDGYIYELFRVNDHFSDYCGFYQGSYGMFFENQVIGPQQEFDIYFDSYSFEPSEYSYAADAYTEFSQDAVIEGTFEISFMQEYYYNENFNRYEYFLDAQVSKLNQNKYYYDFILNLTYDGVSYSTRVYEYYDDFGNKGLNFRSIEKLDLNKLQLSSTPLVVAQRMYSGYVEPTLNVTAMLIALGVGVGGAAIFCAIYFPLKARKKKENE